VNTKEVATYFRSLVNDPDQSFVTDAELATWLAQSYQEFRRKVSTFDRSIYEVSADLPAPVNNQINLDGVLLGSAPTKPRMERISRVCVTDGGTPPSIRRVLQPAGSYEALMNRGDAGYWLQNRILWFNSTINSAIRIDYQVYPTVDWVTGISVANFIDDIAMEFGDIIALLAYNNYKIKDFAESPLQMQKLGARLNDLEAYLAEGRNGLANRYVTSIEDLY